MYHASHIIVCVLIGMTVLEHGNTAKTPAIIDELLTMIANHVGSILTPSLADEIERRILARTATVLPTTTTLKTSTKSHSTKLSTPTGIASTKKSKTTVTPTTIHPTTFRPTTIEKLGAAGKLPDTFQDSDRAPQTQFENQFPFDFRNNFQNYPGPGSLQGSGRQFNGGLFGSRDSFNPDTYRGFNLPLDGERTGENGVQGADPRFPGRESFFNGGNRPFNSQDSPQDFDRYQQNFPQSGFNGRYPGSNRFFDQGFRGDGSDRFPNFVSQPTDDRNNLFPNNYRQDVRANYQNSIANDQGQGLPAFLGSSNPQQAYAQNSFDFLPSQRFQNAYADGFERNSQQQRGPSFSEFFPTRINDGGPPVGTSGSSLVNSNRNKDDGASPGSLQSATRRSDVPEKVLEIDAKPPTLQSTNSQISQTREELEKLFLPRSDDYSDIRTRSDAFKPPLIASNIVAKDPKKIVNP